MSWLNYDSFQYASIKGADQSARIRVRKSPKTGFVMTRPKLFPINLEIVCLMT